MDEEGNRLLSDSIKTLGYNAITASEQRTSVPCLKSCRWITSYMCFLGMILVFAVRANLVMALVCIFPRIDNSQIIVNSTDISFNITGWNDYNIEWELKESEIEVKFRYRENRTIASLWNEKTQGLALSAYYYGSIMSPIVGGYMAMKSAKWVMIVLMTSSAILTAFTPTAMRYNAYATILLRILIGLFGGMYEPAMQHLMASWSPKQERGKLTALTQSGKVVGNVMSFVFSGVLCSKHFLGGWPLTFYGTGILCILWTIALVCLVYDDPEAHPRITTAEKEYVITGLPKRKTKTATTLMNTPWLRMLTSLPFIACILVKFSGSWVFNVQSSNQPMWVRDVLGFAAEENGIFSSLPYVGQFLGSLLSGALTDFAIRTRFSTTVISKTTVFVCLIIPAAGVFSLSFMTERERTLAVIVTIFSTTIYSAVPVALRLNIIELAPKYTGILMGVITTVGCIPGIIAPLLTSIITSQGTQEEWSRVFYMCSGMYAGAAFVYLMLGKAEEQNWNQ